MDLSTKQVMGVQKTYEYAHHIFKPKETFEETDTQGNINLFSTLKTDADSTQEHDSSSLLQVKCPKEPKFEVDNDLFSYSSFKKAMDLRTHNRTLDGVKRTIFDDAEYFAKNYRYKLLPITLEPVNEIVIQVEHSYSLMSLKSESEPEENFSRTMDYSQIKKKNYKRRRTKFREGSDVDEELVEGDSFDTTTNGFHSSPTLPVKEEVLTAEEERNASPYLETDNSVAVQPLDLSTAPLVQEKKTDLHLRESPSSIAENEEVAQPDSDKENVNSELNGVLVTITRPDEIAKYQPCDLFLNDIARLVPKLIGKDCHEVDILDMTCDRRDDFQKNRLYYVISESTWRLFQKTNERVILTNDPSLGEPIRKAEETERPSYLIFDQLSLARCLANYCKEIGGCFEYTSVEEGKKEIGFREEETADKVTETEREIEEVDRNSVEGEKAERATETEGETEKVDEKVMEGEKEIQEVDGNVVEEEKIERVTKTEEEIQKADGKVMEEEKEIQEVDEKVMEGEKEIQKADEKVMEEEKEIQEVDEKVVEEEKEIQEVDEKVVEEEKEIQKADEKVVEEEKEIVDVSQKEPEEEKVEQVSQERNVVTETAPEELTEKVEEAKQDSSELGDASEKECRHPQKEKATEAVVPPPKPEENAPKKADETKQKPPDQNGKTNNKKTETTATKGKNNPKKQSRGTKRKRKSSIQRKPKISRTTPRPSSAPDSETSQKSDKPVSRKGRREPIPAKEEPPNKLTKPSVPEEPYRRTRSGKVLQEVKTNKPTARKRETAGPKGGKKTESRGRGQKPSKAQPKKTEETGRSLRSHKTTQWKEKVQVWSKGKARKR